LAKMACDLAERRGLAPFAGKAHLVFALAVPWTRPVREAIEPLRRAVQMANEQGDLAYAANACNVLTSYLLVAGNPLEQVEREGQRGLEFARMVRFGSGSVTDMISWPLALVRTLRGETARFGVFDDGLFTERSFEERLTGHPTTQECFYWIRKLSARFLA